MDDKKDEEKKDELPPIVGSFEIVLPVDFFGTAPAPAPEKQDEVKPK
jgi:hypothetical protein